MSENARQQVSAELLQYLEFVWDLHYIGKRAWELEANEEVFRMAKIDGDYACEYAPEEGVLWNFELDAAALREIVRGGVRELEVRVRPDDRGQYIGDKEGAAELVRELVAADELELEVDASDDAFDGIVDALSNELAMWFGDMRSLSTVGDQRYAVTELVEWLLDAPGVEDLYLQDIDLYWLLHRRLWDMRGGEEEGGGGDIDMAGLMAMLAENPEPAPAAKPAAKSGGAKSGEKASAAPRVELVDLEFEIAEHPLAAAGHDAADAAGVMLEFPLFAVDMEQAGSYVGPGFCVVQQRKAKHVFELGIGDFIRRVCTKCKTENYLDAMDAEDVPCVSCKTIVEFPSFPGDEVTVSYEAIRAGDVAMTKDTEFGMIGPEQAAAGLTHGEPDMETDQPVELVELEDGWMGAKLPPADMWELLRTPTFVSWQGEVWLFSEGRPMVFKGSWSREDFNERAAAAAVSGGGKALFEAIVEDLPPFDIWERFEPGSEVCVYVFECSRSGVLRANWDMA